MTLEKKIKILSDALKITIEALKDIHSGVPAIDRAGKTLRYLNIEAEEMNQNQEDQEKTN
jgi:hypothetical protein